MDEQQRAVKKKYAGEKQPSMKRRDDNHDYTERRMYMITMEVEGRRPLFGVVTGDPHAPQGSSDSPHIVLSPIGQAVQDEWLGIPRYYPPNRSRCRTDDARPHAWHTVCERADSRSPQPNHQGLQDGLQPPAKGCEKHAACRQTAGFSAGP